MNQEESNLYATEIAASHHVMRDWLAEKGEDADVIKAILVAHEAKKVYVPLSQEECDRLQYATGGWTRKFREAHKLGWDAAMKAQHEADMSKL